MLSLNPVMLNYQKEGFNGEVSEWTQKCYEINVWGSNTCTIGLHTAVFIYKGTSYPMAWQYWGEHGQTGQIWECYWSDDGVDSNKFYIYDWGKDNYNPDINKCVFKSDETDFYARYSKHIPKNVFMLHKVHLSYNEVITCLKNYIDPITLYNYKPSLIKDHSTCTYAVYGNLLVRKWKLDRYKYSACGYTSKLPAYFEELGYPPEVYKCDEAYGIEWGYGHWDTHGFSYNGPINVTLKIPS